MSAARIRIGLLYCAVLVAFVVGFAPAVLARISNPTSSDSITGDLSIDNLDVSATTTTGALQVGSTAIGSNVVKVSPLTGLTTSNSESVGGIVNENYATTDALGHVIYGNSTGSQRLLSIVCDAATYAGNCFHLRSDGTASAVNILGAPTGVGIVKIGTQGVGDSNASGLSIDTSLASNVGQGIFLKGNASGKLLNIRGSDNTEYLTLLPDGALGLQQSAPLYKLDVTGAGRFTSFVDAARFVATSTTATSTFAGGVGIGTINPNTTLDLVATNAVTLTTTPGNLDIRTSDAQAADLGGSLSLGGYNDNAASAFRVFGTIEGRKENSTTGNSAGYLTFKTNNAGTLGGVMRLTSTGLVGIGTTTPQANLQVTNSSANATTSLQFGKPNQNKGTCLTYYDTAGSPVYMYIIAGATTFTSQNGGTAPSGCKN